MQALHAHPRSRWIALAVYSVFGATAFATGYSVVSSAEAGSTPLPSPAASATAPKPHPQPDLRSDPQPDRRSDPQPDLGSNPQPHPEQQRLALEAFRERRWALAYGRYAELADAGDAAAAALALVMVDQGPVLFGSEWSATPGQLQRWSELAARRAKQRRLQIAEHARGE
ncbi:MAG: hypothetical protein U1F25_21145 [Rubrivivax sp.]